MKFRIDAMALGFVLLSAGAAGAQEQGWYVSGGLGPIGIRDSKVTPPAPASAYQIGHKIDAVMQAGVGFKWDQFRIEDEISYSNIQSNPYSPHGHTAIGADLVNALWDLPVNDRWTFSLGAGAGIAQVTETYANLPGRHQKQLRLAGHIGPVLSDGAGRGFLHGLSPPRNHRQEELCVGAHDSIPVR